MRRRRISEQPRNAIPDLGGDYLNRLGGVDFDDPLRIVSRELSVSLFHRSAEFDRLALHAVGRAAFAIDREEPKVGPNAEAHILCRKDKQER